MASPPELGGKYTWRDPHGNGRTYEVGVIQQHTWRYAFRVKILGRPGDPFWVEGDDLRSLQSGRDSRDYGPPADTARMPYNYDNPSGGRGGGRYSGYKRENSGAWQPRGGGVAKRPRLGKRDEPIVQKAIDEILEKYVKDNGQFDIPEDPYLMLVEKYQIEIFTAALSEAIATGGKRKKKPRDGDDDDDDTELEPLFPHEHLPFPFKKYFMGDVTEKYDCIKRLNLESRMDTSEYKEIHGYQGTSRWFGCRLTLEHRDINDGYLRLLTHGEDYNKMDIICDYFTEEARINSCRIGKKSPMQHWSDGDLNYSWLSAMMKKREYREITTHALRETIAYAEDVAECTQFKPSMAFLLIKLLEGQRVLDISSGWGDRLMGAIAADVRYVGVDPNPDLVSGYKEIISTFAADASKYTMIQSPFQTAELPADETFDLILTSPPYFNFELYSNAENQSALETTSLGAWFTEFLFPSLEKAWEVLEDGGHMAIHIVDINPRKAFTEVMNFFITARLKNCGYCGVVCLSGATGSRRNRPVWIWQKKMQLSEHHLTMKEQCEDGLQQEMKKLNIVYPSQIS
eukprot:TRINITY_DN62837_c0_g1_i2.p1 TRINITY_DN62837_c0_g1~~TRINITY_DN62837_c0_g1_i2.p1  ORF type:complete len:571 (+),score=54.96 TRINITY_DN62837_c0_g1_i2:48-1760(+)